MASDDEDSDEDAGDDVAEDSDVTDDDDDRHQPAKLISLAMVKKWTKQLQVSLTKEVHDFSFWSLGFRFFKYINISIHTDKPFME